jgi:hypothetical protein
VRGHKIVVVLLVRIVLAPVVRLSSGIPMTMP